MDEVEMQDIQQNHEQSQKESLKKLSQIQHVHPQDSELTLRQQTSTALRVESLQDIPPNQNNCISVLNVTEKLVIVRAWVSLRLDLVDEILIKLVQGDQARLASEWWCLINCAMEAYSSTQMFARQHLRTVITETIAYYIATDQSTKKPRFSLSPIQHATLVVFLIPIKRDLAIRVLHSLSPTKWTQGCHAVAYHLEWTQAQDDALKAEQFILKAVEEAKQIIRTSSPQFFGQYERGQLEVLYHEKDVLEAEDYEDFNWSRDPSDTASAAAKRSICEVTQPTTDLNLQKKLKNNHWMSLRVKFETSWRSHVESRGEYVIELPPDAVVYAFALLEAILSLAIHFEQYEYAWYWYERSKLPIKWKVVNQCITVCNKGLCHALLNKLDVDAEIWKARGWALYKKVYDIPKKKIHGSQDYISFMKEFIQFVQVTESPEKKLQTYPRLISDMIEHCSSTYFPIKNDLLDPLLQICWNYRNEPREKWERSFRKIFEVYVLHKFYKTRRASTFAKEHYFSALSLIRILSLCTTAGFLDEFKILNRDILKSHFAQDDYVQTVQKGYAAFVKNRNGQLVQDVVGADDEDVPVDLESSPASRIIFDPDTLVTLHTILVDFLSRH